MRIDVVPDTVLLKERHLARLGLGAGELGYFGPGEAKVRHGVTIGPFNRVGRSGMGFAQMDQVKAAQIADRLAQIVPNDDGQIFGERVLIAIQESKPNASTVTGALLLYGGSEWTNDRTRSAIRDLLKAYRDQLMAVEQMECQEGLAASNDRLGRKMFWVAVIGVLITIVGTAATVVPLIPRR